MAVQPSTPLTHPAIRRARRQTITLPDGRVIEGQMPGRDTYTRLEYELRDLLARQLGGITEALLPYGRADVLTTAAVFEVERLETWRQGVRQALAYSVQCGLPPAVALFGKASNAEKRRIYLKLRDGGPPVALWWYREPRWQPVTRCPY